MLNRIKDIIATIGIGIAILFLCAVFVTRVSWLGVFILSALYLSIHIYYQVTDSGKSKADGIMFSGIYVVLIIMSLYQYRQICLIKYFWPYRTKSYFNQTLQYVF